MLYVLLWLLPFGFTFLNLESSRLPNLMSFILIGFMCYIVLVFLCYLVLSLHRAHVAIEFFYDLDWEFGVLNRWLLLRLPIMKTAMGASASTWIRLASMCDTRRSRLKRLKRFTPSARSLARREGNNWSESVLVLPTLNQSRSKFGSKIAGKRRLVWNFWISMTRN